MKTPKVVSNFRGSHHNMPGIFFSLSKNLKHLVYRLNEFLVGKCRVETLERAGEPPEMPLVSDGILDTEQVPHLVADSQVVAVDGADVAQLVRQRHDFHIVRSGGKPLDGFLLAEPPAFLAIAARRGRNP